MKLSTRSIPDEDSHPERADDEKLSKNPYGSSINLKNKFTIKDEKTIFQTSKQEQTMLYQDEFASHQYMREASRLSVIREHEIFDSEMPVKANSGGLKASRLVRHHHQNSDPLPSGEKEIGVDAAVQLSKFAMTAGDWLSVSNKDCNKNKEKVLATFAIGDFENFIFHRLSPTIKANKQSLGMFPVDKLQVQLLSKFTKIQDKDGSLYYGQIKGGLRYGFGGQLDACGHYYEGAWLGDERHGFGRYFSAEGDFFFGQFRQGLFEGEGEYHARDGSVYRGSFHNHRRHGYGIELKATGTKYKGQWAEGRRHGKGLLKYANGDTYQGDFKADVFDGQGVYSWADGSKYEGEYLNGKYHGKGVMTLANGNKFVGDYVKGKPNGFGEFHNRDGGIYRGECSHGKPNGKGVFTNAHGKQFQQVFVNGVRVESIAL